MHRRPLVLALGALLLAAFGAAGAQNAFTSYPMNVRAGPDQGYPLVAQLDAGAPVDVQGCLSDWSWCDVVFDDSRGWIYAGGLSFVYEGERVPLYSYGPSLGLPIVTFVLVPYWDHYYRGRPWYRDRDRWEHRRLPPHLRPRGRPHEGPPPTHGRPHEEQRPHEQRPRPGHQEPRRQEPGRQPMPPNPPRQQRPPPRPPGGRSVPRARPPAQPSSRGEHGVPRARPPAQPSSRRDHPQRPDHPRPPGSR